jgi:hypothetical protein
LGTDSQEHTTNLDQEAKKTLKFMGISVPHKKNFDPVGFALAHIWTIFNTNLIEPSLYY